MYESPNTTMEGQSLEKDVSDDPILIRSDVDINESNFSIFSQTGDFRAPTESFSGPAFALDGSLNLSSLDNLTRVPSFEEKEEELPREVEERRAKRNEQKENAHDNTGADNQAPLESPHKGPVQPVGEDFFRRILSSNLGDTTGQSPRIRPRSKTTPIFIDDPDDNDTKNQLPFHSKDSKE